MRGSRLSFKATGAVVVFNDRSLRRNSHELHELHELHEPKRNSHELHELHEFKLCSHPQLDLLGPATHPATSRNHSCNSWLFV